MTPKVEATVFRRPDTVCAWQLVNYTVAVAVAFYRSAFRLSLLSIRTSTATATTAAAAEEEIATEVHPQSLTERKFSLSGSESTNAAAAFVKVFSAIGEQSSTAVFHSFQLKH